MATAGTRGRLVSLAEPHTAGGHPLATEGKGTPSPVGDAAIQPVASPASLLDRVVTWLGCWTMLTAVIYLGFHVAAHVAGLTPADAIDWVAGVGHALAASVR